MVKSNKQYGLTRRNPFAETFLSPFLSQFPSIFDDENEEFRAVAASNISLSEDEKNVFVEANLPGLKEDDIELSLDKGTLWIRGEKKESEEDKEKKYYYKASRSYSYRVSLPSDIDESSDPSAEFRNGVIHVTFKKAALEQPKKISIKRS